jgi:1-acyl-sn-glycerol-3-phosphate acyltransferase
MSTLRAAARIAAAVLITTPCYLTALACSLLLAPWPRARTRGQGLAFRLWSRGLCRAFGVHVRAAGTPPAPPFVLVSNHVSYLDILVLGTRLPCVFVAKAEIDGWPLFGAICRAVNTIFIDRKAKRELHRVLGRIEETLAAHQGVVIFPEGTSGAGHEVLPFRSPLLELPARLGRPVHWAAISYRVPEGSPPVHLAVTWWGDMPLGQHLWQFLKLRSVEALVTFGGEPIAAADRKHLAEQLWGAIDGVFEPMADPAEIRRLLTLRETDPAALPSILRPRPGPS